jgi:hypothetical protein
MAIKSSEKARELASRRHGPGSYARSLAREWPRMDEKTKREVLVAIAPIIADCSGGRK